MGNTGKKSHLALTVAALVLLIASVGFYCFYAAEAGFHLSAIVGCVIEAALGIAALLYIVNGFKKRYALNYRVYFALVALSYVVETVFCVFDAEEASGYTGLVLGFVPTLICYGNYFLLAFGKDLGKRNSLLLVGINLLLYVGMSAYYMTVCLLGNADGDVFRTAIRYIALLLGCARDLVLVYGKYLDKDERGTV